MEDLPTSIHWLRGSEHQTCHGSDSGGDDPADRTGERHEARTGKDGRTGWRQMPRIQRPRFLPSHIVTAVERALDIERQLLAKMEVKSELYCGYGGNQYDVCQ